MDLQVDPPPQEEPDRRNALIWQPELEAVLTGYATELDVPMLREHMVTAITQDETGVTVTVSTPDGQHERRAAYVVGCDGDTAASESWPGSISREPHRSWSPAMPASRSPASVRGEAPDGLLDSYTGERHPA